MGMALIEVGKATRQQTAISMVWKEQHSIP